MTNVNKLRGKTVERGYTIEKLAKEIGMDRSTLYRKLSSEGESFSIREADTIVRVLNLTKDEAIAIFFSQFVA